MPFKRLLPPSITSRGPTEHHTKSVDFSPKKNQRIFSVHPIKDLEPPHHPQFLFDSPTRKTDGFLGGGGGQFGPFQLNVSPFLPNPTFLQLQFSSKIISPPRPSPAKRLAAEKRLDLGACGTRCQMEILRQFLARKGMRTRS